MQALGVDMKIEGGLVVSALNHVPAAAKGPKPAFKPPQKPARVRKSEAGPSKSGTLKQDRRAGKPKGLHKGQAETAQPFSGKPDGATPQATAKPAVPSDGAQKNAAQNRGAQPKPRAKSGSKPGALSVSRRFEKPRSPLDRARGDGAVVDRQARGAKPAGKPPGKPGNKTAGKKIAGIPSGPYDAKRGGAAGKPKGGKNLAPSVDKPNSKKNKARRAAAHDAGQPPRRAKS